MSAIFGIWHKNGQPVDEKHLLKMQSKVSQYGRDAQDVYFGQNIGLGCCLNKWSKYSQEEVPVYQDARSEIFLACDALIYNRDELIEKYCLTDKEEISTQELLLAAYKKWGENCAKYINGDFTFAIWEKQREQVLLFRDHLGVRPIYYYNSESTFAFATDYRALLALPYIEKQIDEIKLYAELSDIYHIDTEITFFKQIKRLSQAHVMRVDAQGILKRKYWSPGVSKKRFGSEEEYANALYTIVNDAVKLRAESIKEKIASEMSGGLDSSVVTVLAHRELKKDNRSMEAYSWSPAFELLEKQSRDERELIELVCKQEGFACKYNTSFEFLNQKLPLKAVLTDGQRSDGIRGVLKVMSEQENRLVLSGWGGDEGISHRANLFELLWTGYPGYFIKEASFLAEGSLIRFAKLIISNTVMQLFKPYSFFGSQNKDMPNIINKAFEKKMKRKCKENILYFKLDPVRHIESGVIVSRTELSAWIGADYNMQYIFPLLDYRVVDFSMSIPRPLFYKNGISRYIYRKAFENHLPYELCYYIHKDDIAKQTYRSETENIKNKAEHTIKLIDQNLFTSYIDFGRLNSLINSDFFCEPSRRSRFTLRKMETCYEIQRILGQETEPDRK